jgi:hypothetical protein
MALGMVFHVVTEGVIVGRGVSPIGVLVPVAVVFVGFLILVSGTASETAVRPIVGALESEQRPIESFDSLSWSLAPDYSAVFGRTSYMESVTAGGPGLVAVGSFLWTSFDGINWDKVPYDEEAFGWGGTGLSSVTAGGPGLVAVGSGIWSSIDGLTWTRRVESDVGHLCCVIAGGPGLVAVGDTVWTSVDGADWTRVPRDESVFGGVGDQFMSAVTVGGPGLVAVGEDSSGDPDWDSEWDSDAAVWTSIDGISWTRVLHNEAVFGGEGPQTMNSVTAGGPGLVAVGSADGDAAVWTSPDGTTWTRIPHDESTFGDSFMTSVTTAGPGVVAVGQTGLETRVGQSPDAGVWTSVDGISWARVPHDESVFGGRYMAEVTVAGSGLVVVGSSHRAGAGAEVWVAQSEN